MSGILSAGTQIESGAPRSMVSRSLSSGRPVSEDWRLIQACKRGDKSAWNELISRYEKSVYKFAYTLARNYDDAADIAGQVFVRLYENIHTFRNDSHFTSWLFCIVRNVYVDTCIRAPHRAHLSLDDGLEIAGGNNHAAY